MSRAVISSILSLHALGWDLTRLNEQMIEEARTRGEATLRLDYLGVNPQTRIPIFIVEAKPWAAPFVAHSAKGGSAESPEASRPISLICAAIEHCKAGGKPEDSPVTLEWAELSRQTSPIRHDRKRRKWPRRHTPCHALRAMARDLQRSCSHFFGYRESSTPFLSASFRETELVTHAEVIFDELARNSIIDVFPAMVRPSLLPAYIRTADVNRVYRALWVSRHPAGPSWKPRPSLDFEAAMVLERRDGALLTIIDQSLQGQPMPHDYHKMSEHITAVEAQADELLRRVNSELGATLHPSGVEAFPGFPHLALTVTKSVITPGNQPRTNLIKMVAGPGEFLLVTGTPNISCLEHRRLILAIAMIGSSARRKPRRKGMGLSIARSVEPKAFFTSSEVHHCAHRLVHDRRNVRCQIDAFEEFLCCRSLRASDLLLAAAGACEPPLRYR